jgi:hypothetical protein
MKTIRKFFDKNGKEVDESQAVEVHELVIDDAGHVVKDAIYTIKK